MRYYTLNIYDQNSGQLLKQYSAVNQDGSVNFGALNVEFDIPVYRMAEPMGNATIRVWGVGLQEIAQAQNYNGRIIQVYAGMQKGLPLANPQQAGLILQGTIQQAFGNWQDVNQTLDFVVIVLSGSSAAPKNIVLNWRKGQTLGAAIQQALQIAAPTFKVQVNTSANLVLPADEQGFYENMPQFAAYVREVSKHINTAANYPGVDIIVRENTFYVYDGTSATSPKQIAFTELIGQPTWKTAFTMQFKTVMRADINVNDYIQMPQTQTTTTAQSQSNYRNNSIFQGVFRVNIVRHIGNLRQPDGNSWVTVFDCALNSGSGANVSGLVNNVPSAAAP